METVITNERVEHKANIYKVLSVLFRQPQEDFQYYLNHLKISFNKVYPELLPLVEKLEMEFASHDRELTDLKIEHAKLFVGPFDVLVPPYSSIYLHKGRTVYGESTLEALNMYNEAGIEMSTDFKDLPDHISVELEFIYFLYFSYRVKGNDNYYIKQIEKFLNKHLIRWVHSFTEKIEERATVNFYKLLGTILVELVDRDATELTKKVANC